MAGGQGHAVIFQGRGQRRTVAPEPAVERSGVLRLGRVRLPDTIVESLFRFRTEEIIKAAQVVTGVIGVGHGRAVPGFDPGYQGAMTMGTDVIGPWNGQPPGINDRGITGARLLDRVAPGRILIDADMFLARTVAGLPGNAQFGPPASVPTPPPSAKAP